MRWWTVGLVVAAAPAVAAGAFAGGVGGALAEAGPTLSMRPQANCSPAAAREVGKPYFWDDTYTFNQLLCGPFTGPGSDAMAVVFTAPTCWPHQGWAVFSFADGAWKLALLRRVVFIFKLVAVGGDIRETEPIRRAGDSRCTPSGGKRARTWHWNGTQLAAGPWTRVGKAPPPPPPPPSSGLPGVGHFKSPSGNIVCAYLTRGTPPSVECGIKTGLRPKPPYTARCREIGLDHNADRIAVTSSGGRPQPRACSGDAGPFVGSGGASVLGYGKTWSGRAGLSCRSAFAGMTCRNSRGHGFFLSRERWRTF
jgi:uncharacterized protein DUF6636